MRYRQSRKRTEDAKKRGIVFNIHLFIITSTLSIITRDMLKGRGQKASTKEEQGKEMQKRAKR